MRHEQNKTHPNRPNLSFHDHLGFRLLLNAQHGPLLPCTVVPGVITLTYSLSEPLSIISALYPLWLNWPPLRGRVRSQFGFQP